MALAEASLKQVSLDMGDASFGQEIGLETNALKLRAEILWLGYAVVPAALMIRCRSLLCHGC